MVSHGHVQQPPPPDQQPVEHQQRTRALDSPHMGAVAGQQQAPKQQLRDLSPSEMPPHEPSSLPQNGNTSPPRLLKMLHASTECPVSMPENDVQQQERGKNGAAAPPGGAATMPAPPSTATQPANGSAPGAAAQPQPEQQRQGQHTAVPPPAAQPATATPVASPRAAAAGAAPAGPAASPGQQAVANLENMLSRIMNLDVEGWFRHPVREIDAPNYYKIIKQPMCFEVMRGKVRGRQYVNWHELVRDFELICSNAMKYNQRRSRVHKQALVMLRAGKKLLVEMEAEGRRALAALVAAGSGLPTPSSAQAAPADSQAVPSSLYRTGTAGTAPGMLRSQSTADTATTEADSDQMQVDGAAADAIDAAEPEADPAGYSSFEETDLEDQDALEDACPATRGQGVAGQQQLLDYARDAVLVQVLRGAQHGAAGTKAAGDTQPDGVQQPQQPQQGGMQLAAGEAGSPDTVTLQAGAPVQHSKEWKLARRSMEWRARWLEHRLVELQRQRQRYMQQLEAEERRLAGADAAAGAASEQGACGDEQQAAAQQGESQSPYQQQSRLCEPRARQPLPDLQLPGLLAHPFFGDHSGLGVRQLGSSSFAPAAAVESSHAAMDSEDFPAEAYAALDLLDQRLASLRRQLVAMQKPSSQAALQRMQSVRVSGYRGGRRPGGGGYTPRAGATPRGTPRSGSFSRADSLAKRRRIQEYDVGELITPLGAPKFVERAQVRTIDTPRVRTLPASELKRRQAAVEAYQAQLKQGPDADKAGCEAIETLCPGESSSDEDTSDEAYLSRHAQLEVLERARYEALLQTASKRNKLNPSKPGKERSKAHALGHKPGVARTVSAPLLGTGGGGSGAAAATAPGPAAPAPLAGAASAPAAAAARPAAAATPSTAGTGLAAVAAPTPAAIQQQQGEVGTAASSQQTQQQQPQPQQQQSSTAGAGSSKTAAAGPSSTGGLPTGPNGLPLVMIPMSQAMAAHMAHQMMAAAAAANQAGKSGGGGSSGASAAAAAAAAAATSAAMLRPPFTLTPAMAAAMAAAGGGSLAAAAQQAAARQANAAMAAAAAAAAAADPLAGLPPALQSIIPPPTNGSGSTKSRGRPARNAGRPRRNS